MISLEDCLGPEKNLDFLLRALTLLPRERDWRLMLVGSGVEETHLARLARIILHELERGTLCC